MFKINIDEALKYFMICATLYPNNKNIKSVYYNIACCYTRKMNNSWIEWLNKAFESGYTDWIFTLNDGDFETIKDDLEFINIIQKMKNIQQYPPQFSNIAWSSGEGKLTPTEKYLLKYGIE
jgi:hypothetical protein